LYDITRIGSKNIVDESQNMFARSILKLGQQPEKHFLNLRHLEPQITNTRILLEITEAENENDDTYVDVHGKDGTTHQELEEFKWYSEQGKTDMATREVKYALDFTPWEEWLGMQIDPSTLLEFSESEIIAHCLWEMTFHGFEQNKIQTKVAELRSQSEAIKEIPLKVC
jgi:hypothetical protein